MTCVDMSLIYAIPDLHGRYDLLDRAVSQILLHSRGRSSRVVTLGDYVDRGPHSRDIIEFLMNWPLPTLQLIALKGNHEAMMWEACNGLCEVEWWIENGGGATLTSYGVPLARGKLQGVIPEDHLQWIRRLPNLYADEHRIFVHAGVDPGFPLDEQRESTLLWKRYREASGSGHGRRHVVHGHDADERGPHLLSSRTNLDVGAWKTGRLVVGVFCEGQPGGPVEVLKVNSEYP